MKNINKVDNSRRALLKTFAASGISKALISSSPIVAGMLFSRHADAQSDGRPNKTVSIYIPGGAIYDNWIPSGGTGESLQLGSMSAGYESVKTECNFLRNMSHSNGGHGRESILLRNGFSGSTYDVLMGEALGPNMPFSFINLGVHSGGQGNPLTFQGNVGVPAQDNPFNAFNLLFGGGVSMGDTDGSSSNRSAAILDAHAAAAQAINTKLAGYEQERISQHLDAISDTRRRLEDLSSSSGSDNGSSSCAAAPDATEFDLTFDTFTEQANLQADIIAAALSCGLTSSASLSIANNQKEFTLPGVSFSGAYHQSIHGGSGGQAGYPFYVEMRARLAEYSGYLINSLRQRGVLDSTIVLETTDMGHGDLHSSSDIPLLLAGGGGAIQRGVSNAGDSSYNQSDLLETAAQACGVTNLGLGRVVPGVLT